MPAIIFQSALDPCSELEKYQDQNLRPGSYGATASFIGTMRDFNAGDPIRQMTLEHYPQMTQHFLDRLIAEAMTKWSLVDSLIIHRVGVIKPGEAIVLTAAWSAHREEAFTACRFLMEELKLRAPFWKKESTSEGDRWVHEAPGDDR